MSARKLRNTPIRPAQRPTMRPGGRRGAGQTGQKSLYSGAAAFKNAGGTNQRRRESDTDLFKSLKTPKKATISYRAYEIIPRNSPYGHHFKSLLNAESFVAQNEHQMALDIYQRLLNKIPLRSSRDKIEANIRDIEAFSETYEEAQAPRVQVEISYAGPLPGTPQPPGQQANQPAQPGQASMPIQLIAGAPPMSAPGQQGPVMLPFGFAQAEQTADRETRDQLALGKNKPFGFFEKIQDHGEDGEPYKRASEDIVPETNTEKLLKELTDGIFQIEKALFDTSKMKVKSDEAPELPGGEAAPGTREEEEAGQAGEEEAEAAPEAPGAGEKAGEEEESAVTGAAPSEEEEELGEGILEKTSEIGSLDEGEQEEPGEEEEVKPAIQEIRGVLELKEPEQEDTPFITITYDFNKIPHHFFLSKDHNILEYAYYKYKPMLVKAQRFIRKKQITKALNYYRVIRDQQIPDALRLMVDKNIQDISEYLEKYLMTRPG